MTATIRTTAVAATFLRDASATRPSRRHASAPEARAARTARLRRLLAGAAIAAAAAVPAVAGVLATANG
jgi:hypothetical protein